MKFPQKLLSRRTLSNMTQAVILIFILFNLAGVQITNDWENPNVVSFSPF